MSLKEWAKKEIEIACKRERGDTPKYEWDYGCACYESAYKAFLSLLEDDHSGLSIAATMNILDRLVFGKPLTPIEDTPDIWVEATCDQAGKRSYRCTRMNSLTKDVYPDGKVVYRDSSRMYCVDRDDTGGVGYCNGFIGRLIDEKYPIKMPYSPPAKKMIAFCSDGLFDHKNGDFDTIGIWYVQKPDGSKDVIERFFKESGGSWAEISKQEYFERVGGEANHET